MTTTFDKQKAEKAIWVFETILQNKKEITNGKNLGLILFPIMAYLGNFSIKDLKKYVPSLIDPVIQVAREKGLIKLVYRDCSAKENTWTYSFNVQQFMNMTGSSDIPSVSEDICYLFVNCLFNTSKYIKEFKISSWNVLSLALECTLKTGYSSHYISLPNDHIRSVVGNAANKYCAKKTLVDYGFLKKHGKVNSEFSLNRRAFLLGSNK